MVNPAKMATKLLHLSNIHPYINASFWITDSVFDKLEALVLNENCLNTLKSYS